ncbi:hypothetical protein [Geosporobacter ferrireducens]|uniref:Uncharacterized protein n=1 Tax=Geosporobacter ferrireducens TaxID=1424294 RepID=A0A1D8GDY6_9FIRM|nr:hypothetical protein [Geosporobacter ferrireducens]AOT69110.1 hypothetical protein Gferi_05780 [Geosporobacter ferrireducens]MTI56785.1 hypothetical protein [Geosporobacter ferrireducens]
MKAVNNGNDSILIRLFIGCIVSLVIILLMLNNQSGMMRHLEAETYYKLQSSMNRLKEQPDHLNQEISRIIEEYQEKKEEIQKTTIANSIRGFLITIAIILATVSNIIKNIKNILKEILGKSKTDKEHEKKGEHTEKGRECLIPMPADKDWYMSKEIQRLLEEINRLEKSKLSEEMQLLIQQTITLLVGQLVQIFNQTSSFTKQLSHDRENLISGITEMKKGIEQVTQVIEKKNGHSTEYSDEEMIAAMGQMNTVIEEIGELLVGMEQRIQDLTQRFEHHE